MASAVSEVSGLTLIYPGNTLRLERQSASAEEPLVVFMRKHFYIMGNSAGFSMTKNASRRNVQVIKRKAALQQHICVQSVQVLRSGRRQKDIRRMPATLQE